MSEAREAIVLVEGLTEKFFVEAMLVPVLAEKGTFLTPIVISKPGQKGGDVRFARVRNDIELHLKQRRDTFVTLFVDYYGLRPDWPGLDEAKATSTPKQKADAVNTATKEVVVQLYRASRAEARFIPFVAMHEFEALLFSEPQILADALGVKAPVIEKILLECKEPENINDSPKTAPSKRIQALSAGFIKTTTGIRIARDIGLARIRERCPLFDVWLHELEHLQEIPL